MQVHKYDMIHYCEGSKWYNTGQQYIPCVRLEMYFADNCLSLFNKQWCLQ